MVSGFSLHKCEQILILLLEVLEVRKSINFVSGDVLCLRELIFRKILVQGPIASSDQSFLLTVELGSQ